MAQVQTNGAASRVCVFNHVGISVPNCDEAVEWYCSVFGFRSLQPALHVSRKAMPGLPIFKIFDPSLQEFKIAWLISGHSVGLEIFEFIEPKHKTPTGPAFDYCRGGVFHFAMTAADPEKLCQAVVAAGGTKLGETVDLPKGNIAAYCQDPWGNTIELLTETFEQLVTNRAGE